MGVVEMMMGIHADGKLARRCALGGLGAERGGDPFDRHGSGAGWI